MTGERDYSVFTPGERQKEFEALYDQFPAIRLINLTPEEIEDHLVRSEQRADSDHKAVLFQRIVSILEFAQTTDHFRKAIQVRLELLYEAGRPDAMTDDPRVKPPRYLAIGHKTGIFDKESAREIEGNNFLRSGKLHENMKAQGLSDSRIDEERAEWKRQFVEYYGEEP